MENENPNAMPGDTSRTMECPPGIVSTLHFQQQSEHALPAVLPADPACAVCAVRVVDRHTSQDPSSLSCARSACTHTHTHTHTLSVLRWAASLAAVVRPFVACSPLAGRTSSWTRCVYVRARVCVCVCVRVCVCVCVHLHLQHVGHASHFSACACSVGRPCYPLPPC